MSETSFSFDELQKANQADLPPLLFLNASDGLRLAYRNYVPRNPCAALLFYHGGGAHSGAGYQHFGNALQTQFDILVYTPDLRGHGLSAGERGDASDSRQVWGDISLFIKHIRQEFPGLPLILGGHSSGAGLVLNYASQASHEMVDGYLFLSPEFGYQSKTARPAPAKPFARVNVIHFILNAMSGGKLQGHTQAVWFNYPPDILASDPGLVPSYTVNMANAVTPTAPQAQFANLDRPFGLWIGADDELLAPDKVLVYAGLAAAQQAKSEAGSLSGLKHLSILTAAHEAVGPWILKMAETSLH